MLAVAWFAAVDGEASDDGDGILVDPVAGGYGELQLQNATVAEILKSAGYYPAVPPDASEREVELMYENSFFDHDILHFSGKRLGTSDGPWRFLLSDPSPIEAFCFHTRPVADLTWVPISCTLFLSTLSSTPHVCEIQGSLPGNVFKRGPNKNEFV